jgi:hypothetical protein
MGLQKTVFGRVKYKPNTFIGGVSATINTPALIAARLGIAESRIRAFNVIGSDIQFAVIGGSYTFSLNAFTSDSSLTYYHDDGGLATSTNWNTFKSCNNLVSVKFPNIQYFHNNSNGNTAAFHNCFSLTSVYIPKLLRVDYSTFQGCANLVNIDFPLCTVIGNYAFHGCSKLNNLNLPSMVTVGTFSFFNCTGLLSFNFPKVTTIGIFTFYGCSLLSNIDCPLLTTLSDALLQKCVSLTSVNFPNVTSMNSRVFNGDVLLETINLPELLTITMTSFQNETLACFNSVKASVLSFPKLTGITGAYTFYGTTNTGIIYIPKCNTLGNTAGFDQLFNYLKTGCSITVNIALQTNNSGAPDGDLLYAKNTRNAIINFYDDAGNYVTTL